MDRLAELATQEREIQKQLAKVRTDKRVEKMRAGRAERRSHMTADELKADAAIDENYRQTFGTNAGAATLDHLSQTFPAIADGIRERVNRSNDALNAARVGAAQGAAVAANAAVQADKAPGNP